MGIPEIYIAAGGVLLVVSLALAIGYRNTKQLLDELWAVDCYDAKELRRMCSGGFDATVEVEGEVVCAEPLVSLAAGVPCCWFFTQVEREERKTRTVTETDSEGNRRTRTETYYEWDVEYSETFSTVFEIHDSSGFVQVDPTDATIDAETVRSETAYGREHWFPPSVGMSDTGKYRILETAFLPHSYAFVLGQATETADSVLLHFPASGYLDPGKRHFIISRLGEKELARKWQRAAALYFWLAIAALLAAGASFAVTMGLIPAPL